MFKRFEEFLPELRQKELSFAAGGREMTDLIRQEAELRSIESGRFVVCSLNLLMLGYGQQDNSLSLRDSMGFEEGVDLMCDKYKPAPYTADDPDKLLVATGPDLALEFMSMGWRYRVSTEEVLGRAILMGLDVSSSERSGRTLMLTVEGNRHPFGMIF